MKINIGIAFVVAIILHILLILILAINVSLNKPKRPDSLDSNIMKATVVQLGAAAKNAPKIETPAVSSVTKEPIKVDSNKAKEEQLKKNIETQKKLQQEREALALKKKQEQEKKRLEEQKKKELEKKRLAEQKQKELEKKRLEEQKRIAEQKKKELEKQKQEEQKRIAEQKRLEEEKQKLAKEQQKLKEEQQKLAQQKALQQKQQQELDALEQSLLGQADGVANTNAGANSNGSAESQAYGDKIQTLVLQNWYVDPSMNGKKVVVTFNVDNGGLISNEKCQGDSRVCKSALDAIRLIGMMPRPPVNCQECNTVVLTMTPKL